MGSSVWAFINKDDDTCKAARMDTVRARVEDITGECLLWNRAYLNCDV